MTTPQGSIVVGVEGSADSDRAVEWAARAAARLDAALHIVCALNEITAAEEADRILAAARTLAAQKGVTEISAEQVDAAPAPALIAASGSAQLVVVGARGHGALGGIIIGSVSQHVSRHAACPVVVVREPANPRANRIVVGLDGSPESDKALGFAFDAASRAGVPLVAIHGWRFSSAGRAGAAFPISDDIHEQTQAGDRALAEQLAGWAEKYPDVEVTREAIPVHPARVLTDASEQAALVVVGSRGRGAFAGLLLGSVSQAVLSHARCPVAIVR
jgi:nucleotide-binding universal stress UspA family protein